MSAGEVGIWDLDLQSDRMIVCAKVAALLGLPEHPHELSSEEWRARIHPDDLSQIEAEVRATCESGAHFRVEFRARSEAGEFKWLQSNGQIQNNAEGQPVRLLGVTQDITARKRAEQALRESEARFRLLAYTSPDGIFVSCDGRYVYANRAAAKMMGAEHPRELEDFKIENFVDPEILHAVRDRVQEQLNVSYKTTPFTVPYRRLDGREAIAELIYGKTTWHGKDALQILARDVTDQKRINDKLRIMSERLKLAVEGHGEGIWDYDLTTDLYELSGGVREIIGHPEYGVPRSGAEWRRLVHPDDLSRAASAFRRCINGETPTYQCEYRVRASDGSWKWVLSRAVVVSRDAQGRALAMTGTITDITERRESEQVVWRHANLDPLTGLPNRRRFIENLEEELRNRHRTGMITALLFIDLDGFKQVNDLLGHDVGDLVLMEVAHRIKQAIREMDCLARLGGDEFTVLLKNLRDAGRVEFVCQDLLSRLSRPYTVGGEFAYLSASIGIALAPMDAASADEMLRKADTAMYDAKSAGKHQFSYFAQSMDDRAHMRLRVSTELRSAISAQQLSLRYQPVIDLHNGRVYKTEALLRWMHPKLGDVAPSVFIPIAEEAGLMADIGNWVFREAVAHTKQWSEHLGVPLQVALNKSPVQFTRRYMESDWLEYLGELGLPPSSVIIEITEGLLLHASDEVNNKLLEYRDAGIQVAIDDFGTGYSSMAYLQEFDIDYLKIDQSFVRGIPHNSGNCTIAETIIVMAHKLGQQVIAEGIETKEQAEFLIKVGCDFGQGFYFSPPEPAERVVTLLNQRYL